MRRYILIVLTLTVGFLSAYDLNLKHDIWVRGSYTIPNPPEYALGAYYLPELEYMPYESKSGKLDLMLGGYFRGEADLTQPENESIVLKDTEFSAKADLYRAWVRWSSNRYEARLGLQKLNFGTAFILRNEQWFDSVDPRDAMGFTKGVWGALFRYYTANNGTIWFWTILGDDELKGIEYISSKMNSPEFGGRIQMPVFGADQAVSYHFRRLDKDNIFLNDNEHRIALDGRWDTFIGLWYEATLSVYSNEKHSYHKYLTIGSDYTLNIGNGIHILAEHLYQATAMEAFLESETEYNNTALQLEYLIGLYNSLQGLSVYDWDTEKTEMYFAITNTSDYLTTILSYMISPSVTEDTKHTIQLSLRITF
ncbi:MAG: hypothetical protein JXR56_05790 [Candidatus Cloacimonetes bacterium]|nr:hypothetical protein [Candidatus Cloacimonadota bacterium]